MYLLDANACIHILRNSSTNLIERFQRHVPAEIKLCSVVKAELIYGAQRSARIEKNFALLRRFFSVFESYPFDDESAEHYGQIRVALERTGNLIGPNDLMIAAIALTHGLVLVTHNTDEFSRVMNLKLEDWEAGRLVPPQ
jgi:tRNA(fMet)-specific endonuclease VapC